MQTQALDFDLPDDQIAAVPAATRDGARLMVCRRGHTRVEHAHVRDLPQLGLLAPGDLMVKNHTRVLRARLTGIRARTGGRVRGLLLAFHDRRWTVLLESGGRLQPGERITLAAGPPSNPDSAPDSAPDPAPDPDPAPAPHSTLLLHERDDQARWTATLEGNHDTPAVLDAAGLTPLPPYLLTQRRRAGLPDERPDDFERYNTVFAHPAGSPTATRSVAAPTAGLHLTPQLLDTLTAQGIRQAGVTLDIGPGTFAPVRTDTLEDHPIHGETLRIPAATRAALARTRHAGHKTLAVGTTTVRAIESLPRPDQPGHDPTQDFAAETHLFITPDRVARGAFAWQHTDALLTNFHLPQSTLLALVAALPGVGVPQLLDWYQEAVREGYRFYSFGDAMVIV